MIDVLSNYVEATVTTGGTTAPAAGTVETWTVTTTENWPVLAAGQQIRVLDKAQLGSTSGFEIMLVTADANGTGVSWTATRGAEGTTPVAHAADWTAVPATTARGLKNAWAPSRTPQDYGLQLWSDPIENIEGYGSLPYSGETFGRYVQVLSEVTITTLVIIVDGTGTLTSGESFLGVYSVATGDLLGQTADMSTAFSIVGTVKGALTSSLTLPVGAYWLALLLNGSRMPSIAMCRTPGYSASMLGLANALIYGEQVGDGLTTDTALPASLGTSPVNIMNPPFYWIGAY